MAKESGAPTAAEKGKGKAKAADEKTPNGGKADGEMKVDKDGLPILNGKKADDSREGMLDQMINVNSVLTPKCSRGTQRRRSTAKDGARDARVSFTCNMHLPSRVIVCTDEDNLQEPDTSLYKPTLEAIKDLIRTSTSSMTAVPKPLKFLRPHFEGLTETYEKWEAGDDKVDTESASRCLENYLKHSGLSR